MNLRQRISSVRRFATTERGRSIVTFVVFLVIATIFWFMMTLNEVVQREYKLPVTITGIPAGTTLITNPPRYIEVSVKDKGRALVKYDWGTPPAITLRYSDFQSISDSKIVINREMIANNIRNFFGSGCDIASIRPDSISLYTTTRPGDKLPIFLDVDARTEPQYVVYGPMVSSADSATVYSLHGIPTSMVVLHTEQISLRELTDTTTVDVRISAPAGARVEPASVKVTIPVEPLVSKKRILPITYVNVPHGINVLTFPAQVDLNYLVPMSMFNNDNASPAAVVDYRTIKPGSPTVDVTIANIPDYYRSVHPVPAAVECLVEHNAASPSAD